MSTAPKLPTPEEIERHLAEANMYGDAPGMVTRRMLAQVWLIEHKLLSELPVPEVPERVHVAFAQGNPTPKALAEERARNRPKPKLITRSLDDIQEEEVEWLWPGRIPLGAPTLILGRQGDGKSTLMSWLAATVTKGSPWPDVPDDNEAGSVLILQAEESAARSIRPRMSAFGYAPGRVGMVQGVDRGDGRESWFSLAQDTELLAEECDRRKDVRLILVDPLSSYVRGISGYNDTEVREYMQPLFRLAEDYNLSVILVAHPNKDGEKDILDRVSGSGAYTQMVRMSWYLSEDPTNKGRRLLSLMKGNLHGATRTAIAVHYDDRLRKLTWFDDALKLNAREVDHLLQKAAREAKLQAKHGPDPAVRKKAEAFLLDLLKAGPTLQSAAEDQALNRGIKRATFCRAMKSLMESDGRVTRERRGEDVRWWLSLVEPQSEAAEDPPSDAEKAPPEGPEPPA